jgi:hypothetical protein
MQAAQKTPGGGFSIQNLMILEQVVRDAPQTTSNVALWTLVVGTIACSVFRLADCKTRRIFANCNIQFGNRS